MLMLLLACASLASMAIGVLVAYAICRLMFQVFRRHAQLHRVNTLAVSEKMAPSA